jgi:hypothetical protein
MTSGLTEVTVLVALLQFLGILATQSAKLLLRKMKNKAKKVSAAELLHQKSQREDPCPTLEKNPYEKQQQSERKRRNSLNAGLNSLRTSIMTLRRRLKEVPPLETFQQENSPRKETNMNHSSDLENRDMIQELESWSMKCRMRRKSLLAGLMLEGLFLLLLLLNGGGSLPLVVPEGLFSLVYLIASALIKVVWSFAVQP